MLTTKLGIATKAFIAAFRTRVIKLNVVVFNLPVGLVFKSYLYYNEMDLVCQGIRLSKIFKFFPIFRITIFIIIASHPKCQGGKSVNIG